MDMLTLWLLMADAVLALHFGVVLFVTGGALAVAVGGWLSWGWVRAPLWRWLHLGAIGYVVVQSWLGAYCPLTVLEAWLRVQAQEQGYEKSFIEHWVQRLLYYEAPAWVFVAVYSAFGLLVVWLWWRFPPRAWRSTKRGGPMSGR